MKIHSMISKNVKFPPFFPNQCALVKKISFPTYSSLSCNMMPFRMGDKKSLPKNYHSYWTLIQECNIPRDEEGKIGYLTIQESLVKKGMTQRRPGLHTEKHPDASWGGGPWGGGKGLYIASSVAKTCKIWNCFVENTGHMGDCEHLRPQLKNPIILEANQLMWLTDSCPHEALPQEEEGERQFFRLVTSEVALWYKSHSTTNPLVELPKTVKVIEGNKFI